MKKQLFHLYIVFSLSMASSVGIADENSTDINIAERAATQPDNREKQFAGSLQLGAPNRLQVPKLAIRWECQDCSVNEKVAPLIETAYAEEAARNGYVVSYSETAEMVITEYRQRPPGARVMFGIFAGKDKLGVRITYREKERNAEDYSANAWFGMNSLCESVGKQSYQQVLSIIQAEQPTRIE